jgi:BirA family biotin operon repressor/biotin-[acetyl-CoA-carboxylase] ligase
MLLYLYKNTNSLSLAPPIITLGEPLIELVSIDSTNIYANKCIQEGTAVSGSVYRADFQTSGKGQVSKFWESEKGQNLLCSYVIDWGAYEAKGLKRPLFNQQVGFSMAISLALYAFFNEFAVSDVAIKWPNDLYWRDRKAVGILIDNKMKGNDWTWSIIGLGINVNQTQFSSAVPRGVSLKQITGTTYSLPELTTRLSEHLTKSIHKWLQTNPEVHLASFNDILWQKGTKRKFKKQNTSFEATILGVNEKGQLVLDQGIEQTYNFGELIWII